MTAKTIYMIRSKHGEDEGYYLTGRSRSVMRWVPFSKGRVWQRKGDAAVSIKGLKWRYPHPMEIVEITVEEPANVSENT